MTFMYTQVIFDLDGTLLDTLEDLARSANHVCQAHGWPTFPIEAYRYKVGNGVEKLVERFMPTEFAGDPVTAERALAEFRAYYDAHKEDHTRPYLGIPELLDALREAGITLAVLTNKDHAAARPLVERYFGPDCFSVIQGHIDGYKPKPAPPITLHVLEQLGGAPDRTLYVGDSNVDVACGHNAGLDVAGVTWGFRGREELEQAGADYVVDSSTELARVIGLPDSL